MCVCLSVCDDVAVPWEMKMYSPISVRDSLHQCDDLNNMLSVLLIPLPTRMQDPVKRLRHIGTLAHSDHTS